MKHWDEIRTAAEVARQGTISAAAEVLNIHRATVTRHVDALEHALGARLFQRHGRGFSPTELGIELLRIAEATDAQFGELSRLANGTADTMTGSFTVTSVDVLVPLILPIIDKFREQNPSVTLHLVSTDRLLKLEYGEADVALRIGPKPNHPDNVVIPLLKIQVGLYGCLDKVQSYAGPGEGAPKTPYYNWLQNNISQENIALKSDSIAALWEIVRAGVCAGFLPEHIAKSTNLEELQPAQDDWQEQVWAVTHVDLHRSAKVQAFVRCMKETI